MLKQVHFSADARKMHVSETKEKKSGDLLGRAIGILHSVHSSKWTPCDRPRQSCRATQIPEAQMYLLFWRAVRTLPVCSDAAGLVFSHQCVGAKIHRKSPPHAAPQLLRTGSCC